jgi:hypothetical protein
VSCGAQACEEKGERPARASQRAPSGARPSWRSSPNELVFDPSLLFENVFLIPIAGGSKEVAKLIFDYESDFKAKDVRWNKTSPESRAYFSDEYKKERNEMSQQDLAIYKKLTSLVKT